MMTDAQAPIKSAFYGYPIPKQAAETGYVTKPGSNPVLRGIPLAIAGWAYVSPCVSLTIRNPLILHKGNYLRARTQLSLE